MSASNKQTRPNKKATAMPHDILMEAIELFKVPSTGENENLISIFIAKTLDKEGLDYQIDGYGNILIEKGNAPYPCYVAHLDTVHDYDDGFNLVIENVAGRTMLRAHDDSKKFVGVGGDDKCGIFVCLQLLKTLDSCKVVFFSREESGGIGSSNVSLGFFKDCKFIAGIDRWNGQDIITRYGGGKTVSKRFLKDTKSLLREYGYSENTGFFTDCFNLFDRDVGLSCMNISCGYYMHHSDNEYVDTNELYHCLKFCEKLSGMGVYKHKGDTESTFWRKSYRDYVDDFYCKECGYMLMGAEKDYCSSCIKSLGGLDSMDGSFVGTETYCEYCGEEVTEKEEVDMRCCNICYKLALEGDFGSGSLAEPF